MLEFKKIAGPHLIQRGKFKDIEEKNIIGIDSLISFDYMGSSEFEFGALPRSLRGITSSWNQYQVVAVPGVHDADGLAPFLLCRKEQAEEIMGAVKIFMSEEYPKELRTKERVGLYNYLNPQSDYDLHVDFWWDITEDNDWMLCFGAFNMRRLVIAVDKVSIKHGSNLIGPELPKPSFKPTVDFDWEQDHTRTIVTILDKKTVLVRKNLVSMEEGPDQLKIMVRAKLGDLKPIYLKTRHGQARQAMVNTIKEIIQFNSIQGAMHESE